MLDALDIGALRLLVGGCAGSRVTVVDAGRWGSATAVPVGAVVGAAPRVGVSGPWVVASGPCAGMLWGLPVAISNAVTQGQSWVKSRDCIELDMDEIGVRLNWGVANDDFERNLVRARLEGRFEVPVLAPLGICRAAIAQTTQPG